MAAAVGRLEIAESEATLVAIEGDHVSWICTTPRRQAVVTRRAWSTSARCFGSKSTRARRWAMVIYAARARDGRQERRHASIARVARKRIRADCASPCSAARRNRLEYRCQPETSRI